MADKFTRIVYSKDLNASKYRALEEQARLLGQVRSRCWHEFGSLKGDGKYTDFSQRTIRDAWIKDPSISFAPLAAKAWKGTMQDAWGDMAAYDKAQKKKVMRDLHRRFKDKKVVTAYYKQLYSCNKAWLKSPLLRRLMRKYKPKGQNRTHNQIVLDADVYQQKLINNQNWLSVPSLQRYKRIRIPLNSTIKLKGQIRIILRNGLVEVHHTAKGRVVKPCGTKTLGLDKGHQVILADSDGNDFGAKFNLKCNKFSDQETARDAERNRLYAQEKALRGKARYDKRSARKADNIRKNNLGTQRRTKVRTKFKKQVKTAVYSAVHQVLDKAAVLVVEDLSFTASGKNMGRRVNRLVSSWRKGYIQEALESGSKRRGSALVMVNAAYTSQICSKTGLLEGRRSGNKFYHTGKYSGVVSDAGHNAAVNVLARASDQEINLYTPKDQVKKILLERLKTAKTEDLATSVVTAPPGPGKQ